MRRGGSQLVYQAMDCVKKAMIIPNGPASLRPSIEALRSGGVVALPTDTIYGVAALAQNTKAVNKLYHIKRRQPLKPLAICVGHIEQVHRWCHVNVDEKLLSQLLPGPVTLVFKRRRQLNPELNSHCKLVGVRIPDHRFVRRLCDELNEPLALTSANVSEGVSTISPEEFKELWPEIDVVYDGGLLLNDRERLGSTVLDLSEPNSYKVVRKGCGYEKVIALLDSFHLKRRGLKLSS